MNLVVKLILLFDFKLSSIILASFIFWQNVISLVISKLSNSLFIEFTYLSESISLPFSASSFST